MKVIILFISLTFASCTQVIFQPDRVLYQKPSDLGFEVREEIVASMDGTKLGAWFLKGKLSPNSAQMIKEKTLVVFFHGNAQNISAHFSVVSWMSHHGVDVFLGDYRGYGISEGEPNPEDAVLDSLAFLNKAYEYFKNSDYKKFIVYSQSLGGALTISALEKFQYRNEVDLLVLDSTFRSPKEVAHDKIWGLGYLLISDSAFAKNLSHLQMPTLVIHGTIDQVIPHKFGEELFTGLTHDKKWWWLLPGVRHIETFHFQNGFYRQRFISFLNEL